MSLKRLELCRKSLVRKMKSCLDCGSDALCSQVEKSQYEDEKEVFKEDSKSATEPPLKDKFLVEDSDPYLLKS